MFLALGLCPEGGDGIGHHIAGHEGPRVQLAPELLGQDDEVDQGLLGDTAALVLGRDEHRRPTELGPPAPDPRIEELGLLQGAPDLGQRLVLGQEAARRRAQELLVFAETEIHGLAQCLLGPPRTASHLALGGGPVLVAQDALVELATVGTRELSRKSTLRGHL